MSQTSQDTRGIEHIPDDSGSMVYVYMISSVAAVGGLLFGFDTAIIAGAIEKVRTHFALHPMQEGWAVSSLLVGCMIGAAVAGVLSDRWGRKKILVVTAAFYIGSAILAGLPRTLTELVLARFLGGLAVGISSMVAPMYIAELAPARIRGRLVTLNQMAIVTGILLANVVSGLLVDTSPNDWRWMFASAAVPSFLLFIALLGVPESPRWLAKRGAYEQAGSILARVNGPQRAGEELEEIRLALAQESGSFLDLFGPGLRVALAIGVVLAILGQVSGINTIIYYAPKIFLAAGFEATRSATWATVLVGITNFVSTIISLWVIDKVGRRPLLLWGPAGMGIAMVLAALFLTSTAVGLAVKVAIVLVYIASFGVGVGGTVWVVISEIFPTKIRGRAASVATVAVWAACFAVAQTFPYFISRLGPRSFWIYAAMCLLMVLFVWRVVPETKGKSLEEIERMWRRQDHRRPTCG